MKINVVPVNARGRQLVKEHGNSWEILRVSPEGDVLVKPLTEGCRYCRWISKENDEVLRVDDQ